MTRSTDSASAEEDRLNRLRNDTYDRFLGPFNHDDATYIADVLVELAEHQSSADASLRQVAHEFYLSAWNLYQMLDQQLNEDQSAEEGEVTKQLVTAAAQRFGADSRRLITLLRSDAQKSSDGGEGGGGPKGPNDGGQSSVTPGPSSADGKVAERTAPATSGTATSVQYEGNQRVVTAADEAASDDRQAFLDAFCAEAVKRGYGWSGQVVKVLEATLDKLGVPSNDGPTAARYNWLVDHYNSALDYRESTEGLPAYTIDRLKHWPGTDDVGDDNNQGGKP